MRARLNPTAIAVVSVAVMVGIYVALGWNGWGEPAGNEAVGLPSRWCERVREGLIRERSNALSNMGFVVAGIVILQILQRDDPADRRSFSSHKPMALLFGAAVVFLGPGSAAMHGSNTHWGGWIDVLSMVVYILIHPLYNLYRLGRWKQRTFFGVYSAVVLVHAVGSQVFGGGLGVNLDIFEVAIAISAISELLYYFWSPLMRVLSGFLGFPLALIIGVTPMDVVTDPLRHWWVVLFWLPGLVANTPPGRVRRYRPWYWAGNASFTIAFLIWNTGTPNHPWCNPDSIVQAHAIWHLLTAFATFCFFMFLRTERLHANL